MTSHETAHAASPERFGIDTRSTQELPVAGRQHGEKLRKVERLKEVTRRTDFLFERF
jgi:hypothetical protein